MTLKSLQIAFMKRSSPEGTGLTLVSKPLSLNRMVKQKLFN